jgi:hypothetical protein
MNQSEIKFVVGEFTVSDVALVATSETTNGQEWGNTYV